MQLSENQLRKCIRNVISEFFFMNLIPDEGDEDEGEYSLAKRIGGRHTARLDYSEADDHGLDEEVDEED